MRDSELCYSISNRKGRGENGTETRDKHTAILKISNACVVLAPIGGCPSSMQQGEGVTAG